MKKNDSIELVIEDMGTDGEGIGHVATEDGRSIAVFVKDAVMGDTIRAAITKVKKQYVYARLVEVIKPSPYRVEPKCPVARPCGGCTLQHVSYEKQLDYKWNKVKNCLSRIGGIEHPEDLMEPIIGMENPWNYRNKAQFPVGMSKDGRIIAGFYAGRTHSIVPVETCFIQHPENEKLMDIVRRWMNDHQVSAYDETTHKGLVRHIFTRIGKYTGEIMVCLVINGNKIPAAQDLIERLVQVPGMKSICLNLNREKTNVILGNEVKYLWGEHFITDFIGDVKYRISPLSFFQVNPVQTQKLYQTALEYGDIKKDEVVWDLYCGIGTISLFLAKHAKQVCGVEIVPQAIDDARENARLNGIQNASFFVGKAEEVVPQQYEENGISADVIVVDPPRKGCDEKLLDCMVKMAPERIVYVSCDPATLARDLKFLEEHGYKVMKVRCVDMFPHSVHVETVVLLSRKTPDDTIEVDLNLDELDATSAETKATYEEIKKYVKEKYQLKVSNLYISQIKRKCGIEVGINYNLPKSENPKVPQCPPEKERAIRDALEHFQMVS